jgi:bifunctional UDP-N-acetylglucosamine pyrophosphorylase/glucosamine-1-phosphate N-acetyltransferase
MGLEVVVLAAGQGTRMRSRLPKVLHRLAGEPLLSHVLKAARALEPDRIHVVIGHAAETVRSEFAAAKDIVWVHQAEQRGTGHALRQALPGIDPRANVLELFGDVPLVTAATLEACRAHSGEGIAIVTTETQRPGALGRILRDERGAVRGIVEARDATPEQLAIREINSGILCAPARLLAGLLESITPHNAQGEYYLTDVIALAVSRGVPVRTVAASCEQEVTGVNDRTELAALERLLQRRQAERLMAGGVTLMDPARFDVRGRVTSGIDCVIDVDVVLEGRVVLGDDVRLGAGCVIRDAEIGDGTIIHPHTVIDGARIGAGCEIGPFARMRPGSELAERVKIGNFVETKKTKLGRGTKSNHFAYLGDTTTGADCNIGAGTIMCNYDGFAKHPTVLGDGVFIGSNATLVAPLEIADGAYVAAGSTVTSAVGKGDLAVGRAKQRNIQGWTPPARRRRAGAQPHDPSDRED